jgi:hypothetical protein
MFHSFAKPSNRLGEHDRETSRRSDGSIRNRTPSRLQPIARFRHVFCAPFFRAPPPTAHDSKMCLASALRAIPGAAAVRSLVVASVRATRVVDVLVPSCALERSNRAEPYVEVGLPLRTHLRVRATAGTCDLVVRRRVRRHRHGRPASRSLGRPDDGDDVLAPRVRPVDDAVARGHAIPNESFEDLDHHFQAKRRLADDGGWIGAS